MKDLCFARIHVPAAGDRLDFSTCGKDNYDTQRPTFNATYKCGNTKVKSINNLSSHDPVSFNCADDKIPDDDVYGCNRIVLMIEDEINMKNIEQPIFYVPIFPIFPC